MSITLKKGWNWISFNLVAENMNINQYLSGSESEWTDGDVVKSQSATSVYSESQGQWSESTGLVEIQLDTMYKIYIQSDTVTLTITGRVPWREETSQVIYGNNSWNWLSYPLSEESEVIDILTETKASNNDLLKSDTAFTLHDSNGLWNPYGNLEKFTMNTGYILKSNNTYDLDFDSLDSSFEGQLYTIENMVINEESGTGTLDLIIDTDRIDLSSGIHDNKIRAGQVKMNHITITGVNPVSFLQFKTSRFNSIFQSVLQQTGDYFLASQSALTDDQYICWNTLTEPVGSGSSSNTVDSSGLFSNIFYSEDTVFFIDPIGDGFLISELSESKIKFEVEFNVNGVPTINSGILIDSTYDNDGTGQEYFEIESTINTNLRITINMNGTYDASDENLMNDAAQFWSQIITQRTRPDEAEDFIINVTLRELSPNILGSAGPSAYFTRYDNKKIAYQGNMTFNTLNWGSQKSTIKPNGKSEAFFTAVHEIGHILGIGTMWTLNGLNQSNIPSLNNNEWYFGENALREYRLYCNNQTLVAVPLEEDGGGGTAYGHPEEGDILYDDERTYNENTYPGLENELMTGWSENESTHEPISKVSIGFLEDLGFTVDYNMAENYTVSGVLRNNRRKGRGPVVAQREISRHVYPFEPIQCGCKM